jgi:hypothetical protein
MSTLLSRLGLSRSIIRQSIGCPSRTTASSGLRFAALLVTMTALVPSAVHAETNSSVQALPLRINSVAVANGGLVANGSLGSTNFQLPLTVTAEPNTADPTCPILHLAIPQGIHLSLLGLNVDTSAICLNITAQSGPGNLLGNLLCDIANLLNQNTPLSNILSGLSAADLTTLENGLTSLLNSVLTTATTVTSVATNRGTLSLTSDVGATASVDPAKCNILHLALGPVSLNLLGLMVQLDNCNGGPITVDITATPGAGNLLGNLICNLSNLLNNAQASLTAIERKLQLIARLIQSLI